MEIRELRVSPIAPCRRTMTFEPEEGVSFVVTCIYPLCLKCNLNDEVTHCPEDQPAIKIAIEG